MEGEGDGVVWRRMCKANGMASVGKGGAKQKQGTWRATEMEGQKVKSPRGRKEQGRRGQQRWQVGWACPPPTSEVGAARAHIHRRCGTRLPDAHFS